MSSKAVLQNEIPVCEGSVIEVSPECIWVEDQQGRQTSISYPESSGRFRVGHKVKIAVLATDVGYKLIKGFNLTTGEALHGIQEMHERQDTSGFLGLVRAGVGTLFGIHPMFALALIVPLLNALVAIFFVIFALGLASATRSPWSVFTTTVLVGCGAIGVLVLFCVLSPSLVLFSLWAAPAVGVLAGYCYLGRTLANQFNEAIDKVDQQLGLA